MTAPTTERYVIRGGKRGYDRLLLLAQDRWPDTLALFQRAGIAPGMRCLDLGCGGGAVTVEMARLVAPGGSATGVDMDSVKLDLARQAAAERHLDNVDFRVVNAHAWNEPGAYDVVFSRFLLQHLKDPIGLLRRMWAGVRPGGCLIVEDADFDGWCCYPPNEGLDFFKRVYSETLHRNGGDPFIGRKLLSYFIELGIPSPNVGLVQPVRVKGEPKRLPWTTLEAASESIISAGLATSAQLEAALESLDRFTEDPRTLISGPRIFQLWSQREPARQNSPPVKP